jgi:hypothetical protein
MTDNDNDDGPQLMGVNKKVPCTPFEDMSVKKSVEGTGAVKVARIENQKALVSLTVVAASYDLPLSQGDTVLLRGDLFAMPWAKEIHEFNGTKYILVPFDRIEAIVLR